MQRFILTRVKEKAPGQYLFKNVIPYWIGLRSGAVPLSSPSIFSGIPGCDQGCPLPIFYYKHYMLPGFSLAILRHKGAGPLLLHRSCNHLLFVW